MQRSIVATSVMAAALAACTQYPEFEGLPPPAAPTGGTPQVEAAATPAATLVYAPPARGPGVVPSDVFAVKRFRVVRSIGEAAAARGLEVTHQDTSRGLVVAEYEGPVLDYVDCGTYSTPTGAFSVPAIGSKMSRPTGSAAEGEKVDQDTRLNARLVALVERQGDEAASARVDAHYVLRRDLVFVDGGGRALRRNREFVDLTTDRQARFGDGTTCVATGVLERSILPRPEEIELGS